MRVRRRLGRDGARVHLLLGRDGGVAGRRARRDGLHGMLDRVFARGQQVTGAAMLIGTVGGGLLGQIDLSLPYLVRSVLLAAVFVVALVVMHDLGFTPRRVTARELPGEVARNARAGVHFGWSQRLAAPPDARVARADGVPHMGVLRLAAVPPRAARERRDLDRRAGRVGDRALDDRRQPARRRCSRGAADGARRSCSARPSSRRARRSASGCRLVLGRAAGAPARDRRRSG